MGVPYGAMIAILRLSSHAEVEGSYSSAVEGTTKCFVFWTVWINDWMIFGKNMICCVHGILIQS